MSKRLADLVQLESNTKDCAVFTIKSEVSPLDLVKLGGFEGHECMFRMSKDLSTTSITVFRDGDEPYHMDYGSSTTLVGESRRKVRDLIMECVNLDFGIVTGGRGVRSRSSFERLVEDTCGERDLNSRREFEYTKAPGGDGVLFVNGQHVAHVRQRDFDSWLSEKDIRMVRNAYEQPTGNGCTIVRGTFERRADEPARDAGASQDPEMRYSHALDRALDSFLGKTGWQGLDAPSIVVEFVRFAKQEMEPSLADLKNEAKEKSRIRNAERPDQSKERKPQDKER